MTVESQKNFIIKVLFYTALAAIGYFALRLLTGPLLPFLSAAALSVILQGLLRKWVKKFNLRKKPASVALVVAIYLTVGVILGWLGYLLYSQLSEFVTDLPEYFEGISKRFSSVGKFLGKFSGKVGQANDKTMESVTDEAIKTVTSKGTEWLTQVVANFAAAIPGFLLSLAVMIIAGAYFVKDYDEISGFILKSVSRKTADRLVFIKDVILKKVTALLKGYLLIIVLTFSELAIGFWILDVKYALVIAFFTSLIDILPVLGSGTVLLPWALFAILSGNITRAIGLAVLYVVITAIRNVVEPKIIGSKLGVHPLLMLISMFLGLRFFGAVGVLTAPFAIVVVTSVWQLKNRDGSATM